MSKTHIIIGSSAAGISAVNTLRTLDPKADIICISDETELPYNKCHLADYVAGLKTSDQVNTFTLERAIEKKIEFMLGVAVVLIEPAKKIVHLSDGKQLSYDTLFIGTGTSPIKPPIPGIDGVNGVFTFHGLRDAQAILNYVGHNSPKTVVVIGAGLSGLECADALINHVPSISVVEMGGQVLSGLIPHQASSFIERAIANHTVQLYISEKVEYVLSEHGRVTGVVLASGKQLMADMLICAVGVRPNSALAEQAGIIVAGSGILVDEYMQTSVPSIYAGGDVILVKDQITGELVQSRTWPDAMLQGLVAAHTMAGKQRAYPGVAVITSSAFFGLKFASCGPIHMPGYEVVIQEGESYNLFLLKDSRLKGFVVVAESLNIGALKRAVLTGQTVTKEQLLQGF